MAPSNLTLAYDALLSTTLFNYAPTIEDNISKENVFMWHMKKKVEGGYQTVTDIGDRMQVGLMYELGQADSMSGYDVMESTPMDGVTSAFFEWRQASVPITISNMERKKNSGEARITSLLETKTKQAELGIQDFFNRRFLIGAGGSSITTAYTSPTNGSAFVDPLPLLVAYDPTTSTAVGNINQLTYSWWRNYSASSTSATFAAFLVELRKLRMKCGRGPGGKPDLHLVDEDTYALYEQALATKHQNPSYQKADIPFENIAFYGSPVVAEEILPDFQGGSATLSTTSGSWVMLNSKFFQVKVHADTNFAPTKFKEPDDQDIMSAHILWLGGIGVSNRRKHGVLGGIDTTISS